MTAVAAPPAPPRSGSFGRLLCAFTTSAVGQSFASVAVIAAVYERTRSPVWATAAALTRLLPYVLGSGFAGVVVDRFGRRRTFIGSCASRSAIALALAVVTATGASPALIVAVAFALILAGTPSYPAVIASVPDTVEGDRLLRANAVLATVESVMWIAGPALAGLALLALSPAAVMCADALIFLLATLLARRCRGTGAVYGTDAESFLLQLAEGLRACRASAGVMTAIAVVLATSFIDGAATVATVLVADRLLGLGPTGFGVLTFAMGAGGVLGVVLIGRVCSAADPGRTMRATTLLCGVCLALLAVSGSAPVAVVLLMVMGAGVVLTEVVAITVVQRTVAPELTARVFGIIDALLVAAIACGAAVVAPLADAVGLRAALVIIGAGVPMATSIAALTARTARRRLPPSNCEPQPSLLTATAHTYPAPAEV